MLIAEILPPRLGLSWAHKALEAMPTWPAPWFCLARTYQRMGNHLAAAQFAKSELALDNPRTTSVVNPSEHDHARVLHATSLAATILHSHQQDVHLEAAAQ